MQRSVYQRQIATLVANGIDPASGNEIIPKINYQDSAYTKTVDILKTIIEDQTKNAFPFYDK